MLGGTALTSPLDAVKKVEKILTDYNEAHKQDTSSWATVATTELAAFKLKFPQEPVNGLSLDILKEYTLKMADKFIVTLKSALYLEGNSKLRTDLINEAKKWPTQEQYLANKATILEEKLRAKEQELQRTKEEDEAKLARELQALKVSNDAAHLQELEKVQSEKAGMSEQLERLTKQLEDLRTVNTRLATETQSTRALLLQQQSASKATSPVASSATTNSRPSPVARKINKK